MYFGRLQLGGRAMPAAGGERCCWSSWQGGSQLPSSPTHCHHILIKRRAPLLQWLFLFYFILLYFILFYFYFFSPQNDHVSFSSCKLCSQPHFQAGLNLGVLFILESPLSHRAQPDCALLCAGAPSPQATLSAQPGWQESECDGHTDAFSVVDISCFAPQVLPMASRVPLSVPPPLRSSNPIETTARTTAVCRAQEGGMGCLCLRVNCWVESDSGTSWHGGNRRTTHVLTSHIFAPGEQRKRQPML